ncbi:hypothetical protein BV898_16691 [Hypsibius exemplaris]|uniref:IPT/TIG domain-containing protein n=1 Tax=Hypsibius exemplaris TaxID=2072580 RepID=A0A9X6NDZ0_HYPEX|nr:hypothetical protein BV898_16691 [Hypsibius exemplaris]
MACVFPRTCWIVFIFVELIDASSTNGRQTRGFALSFPRPYPEAVCEEQTECGACHTNTSSGFGCGWCTRRGGLCTTRSECGQIQRGTWHGGDTCPPEILSISPKGGSVSGGTNLTILGNHFGQVTAFVDVKIGDMSCEVTGHSYTSINCSTLPSPAPGPIQLIVEVREEKPAKAKFKCDGYSRTDDAIFLYLTDLEMAAMIRESAPVGRTLRPTSAEEIWNQSGDPMILLENITARPDRTFNWTGPNATADLPLSVIFRKVQAPIETDSVPPTLFAGSFLLQLFAGLGSGFLVLFLVGLFLAVNRRRKRAKQARNWAKRDRSRISLSEAHSRRLEPLLSDEQSQFLKDRCVKQLGSFKVLRNNTNAVSSSHFAGAGTTIIDD